MKKIVVLSSVVAAAGIAAVYTIAAEPKEPSATASPDTSTATAGSEHNLITPAELKWGDAPPGLPPGGKLAVLNGDPNKAGPFTVRLKTAANYKILPHTHPTDERVTVISGTVFLAMGEKFDEKAGRALGPGSFANLPANMAHYAWSKKEAIVQIDSEGPFEIKYVNSADDPREGKR